MMQQLLSNWPLIVLAQLLSVGVVWSVDMLGWKWRRDEEVVFTFNTLGLIVVAPIVGLSALFSTYSQQDVLSIGAMLMVWLSWLLFVAWVQKQQFQITLRAAFFGAMMQLGLFVILSCPVGGVTLFVIPFPVDWFMLTIPVSMLGTYFLLTLFRPQLWLLWNSIRQSFRKNQPLR